jgi:hypothetical protein
MCIKNRTGLFGASVVTALISGPALGAITVYTNRPMFLTDAGPLTHTEDFQGFLSDIDFSSTTISDPNGFSIGHSGTDPFRNLIDVPPLDFADGNGTASISGFVNADGIDIVTMTPDAPAIAFGFDASGAASSEGVTVDVFGPGNVLLTTVNLTNGIDDFFGFITTGGDTITSLVLRGTTVVPGTGGEGFRMDNFAISIPTPGTLALLGLAGLISRGRRRG